MLRLLPAPVLDLPPVCSRLLCLTGLSSLLGARRARRARAEPAGLVGPAQPVKARGPVEARRRPGPDMVPFSRKSRVGKILQNRCGMRDTQENTEKKRCEMQSSTCFCTVQPGGWRTFLLYKTQHRCESKSRVQLRVNKVPKLEFQHMPAKVIAPHHPARRQTQRLPTTTTKTKNKTQHQQQQQQQQQQDR